jgi:endonuclease-3
MNIEERASRILQLLDEHDPTDGKSFLDYETPWQLLVATRLSAQCTDARVNMVTTELFAKYPGPRELAEAELSELEACIKPVGVYHNKAKNIKAASRQLLDEHDGQLPRELAELTKLPGVGRKTGNLVRGHIYGLPGIVVDTHVKRVSNKWGLTVSSDPEKIEYDLMKILPEEHWIRFNPQVISHGRAVCKARRPECNKCVFAGYCAAFAGEGV